MANMTSNIHLQQYLMGPAFKYGAHDLWAHKYQLNTTYEIVPAPQIFHFNHCMHPQMK